MGDRYWLLVAAQGRGWYVIELFAVLKPQAGVLESCRFAALPGPSVGEWRSSRLRLVPTYASPRRRRHHHSAPRNAVNGSNHQADLIGYHVSTRDTGSNAAAKRSDRLCNRDSPMVNPLRDETNAAMMSGSSARAGFATESTTKDLLSVVEPAVTMRR